MSNRAWVTLATNDSYGLGALVLAHSLRRVSSEHPAVVLITPSVTDAMRERLNAVFSEVVIVDVLDSRDAAHLALLQRPELGITFTKIHCWSLTQFEKCVFLDADTLVVQNCDELFEREELSAAPDVGWPDCFNSGVFVFKPSKETFEKLIAFAQERGSFDGGDQGLLNSFFSDWARADINKHLPFLYNVTSAAFYSYLPALKQFGQDLKIIHFIGAAKPWLQHFNFESRTVDAPDHIKGLLQLWWDIFVGEVHSQLDASMTGVAGNLARVVAGGPHETLDDLTRRQGWEAGNIDYMGADSFDNIWAKISQALTQPRSPSPPKESPPQEIPVQAVEATEAVVSEQVAVAKEAVLVATPTPAAPEPAPVVEPVPAPVVEPVSAPVVEPVPAPVEKPTPAPVVQPTPAPVVQPIPAPVAEPAPVATPVKEPVATTAAPVKETLVVSPPEVETPAPAAPAKVETPVAPIESAAIEDIPVTVADKEPVTEPKKTESVEAPAALKTPSTPPTTPKTPEAATPEKTVLPSCPVATHNKLVTDSPPLANTPSKEEAAKVPAAKSEERERRKVGKLQLCPPATADPLPTPDSEAEDAAALAHAIITSELRAVQTPTVTSPQTPAAPASPLTPKAGLTVDGPQVPTPPVTAAAVSLAQIGVKPKEKTTTAAQLESSIAAATEKPDVPKDAPKDAPKKKIIKKVVKKVDKEAAVAAAGADAPVPPPRKKEKKPKEK